MKKLILVTLIWAFSFSLIGEYLAGKVDVYFAAFSRSFISLLAFIPFIIKNFNKKDLKTYTQIALIGAIQIGLMYICYYNSFIYLSVTEIALFTIFTPFYVSIFYDLFKGKIKLLYLISIAIAVIGAGIIKYNQINDNFWFGFLLVQIANICFGLGQSAYKYILENKNFKQQRNLFGYFFVGASIITGLAFITIGDFTKINLNNTQIFILIWLALGASTFGYFLWNKGACEVDSGTLAIMNNALIPVAIIVNLIFWNKPTELVKLIIGGLTIYLSLIVHRQIIKYYKTKDNK